MNNRDLFIYAQTNKNKRTLSETKSTLKSLIDRSITSIEFPDRITSIGDYAFAGCVDLNITIPDNLEIGDNAFFNCNNVNIITDTKPQYELDANSKFYGCNNLTIIVPEGTAAIAEEAFKGCTIMTEVVTPSTVTEIRPKAFMDCSRLKKATIVSNSASEFKLLLGAFSQCYNLEEVTLPSTIKVINAYTFYKNYNLQTINMPSSLVRIETGAFLQCNSLTNITLPSGVQYLRNQAFYDCSGLKTISIPNSIKEFGDRAFGSCSSLENVVFESEFNAKGLDLSASTLYSVNTLVTMLNALANRTGQVPYTLTLGSTK